MKISENNIERKFAPEFPIKILFCKLSIRIRNKEINIEKYKVLVVPEINIRAIIQYMQRPEVMPFAPSEKLSAL